MLTRAFGRDEHPFRLRVAEWRAIEKTCNSGLAEIAGRIAPVVLLMAGGLARHPGGLLGAIAEGQMGSARLDDVREPLVQGLIGGGMGSTEAGALVRMMFDEVLGAGHAPMLAYAELAFAILAQALIGLEDEPLGE
jgi:hypothetical protein